MKAPKLPTYNSQLSITAAIEQAKQDTRYLPGLYLRLLKEDIYVLVDKQTSGGYYTSNFSANVSIVKLDNGKIPIFTSVKQIYEGGAITTEMEYMKVNARSFFEMMLGSDSVLNPFSASCLQLSATQLMHLLDNSFFSAAPVYDDIEPIQLELKVAQQIPKALIQAVNCYFATVPAIEKAYIATLLDKRIEKKPHYIIALVCDTITKPTFTKIVAKVSTICTENAKREQFIDVIKLTKEHPYYTFFTTQTTPFFVQETN